MAYATLIAAVPPNQVAQIRADANVILRPTKVLSVSHWLAYGIESQPFGSLLGEAIDGGEVLHEDFWHPLRPPMWHRETDVPRLTLDLTDQWENIAPPVEEPDDWLRLEISRLLEVLTHAVETSVCVVTALDFPGGDDRRRRTRIPWFPPVEQQANPLWRKWLLRLWNS
ncbi:hypothetical protein [Blastopirellula marina]|uniref:Uncharacterized protein n=1 Tax=Blastopirellula marina TaxID=124 RepID=A0A2S8FLM7_9BACT|nr:hypothetical protein [Blastopirellula marina]PQO33085.1 hypothetical protein C5Y98_18295 [Blastopirellula marina]PTL43252.1 hypothetical protein C5Y97_18305 [Blastopirellula marina]